MRIQCVEKNHTTFLDQQSTGSLSVLSSRVHCCTRYCAKNLAEPPLGSGSHPESAASPPPTAGVRWHRRPTARSSCSRLSTGRPCRCVHAFGRCAARDICGRAPSPLCPSPTHRFDQRPTSSADFVPSLPHLSLLKQRSSVYVAVVIAGALVGEKVRPSPTTLDASAPPGFAPDPRLPGQRPAWRGHF